MPAITVVRDDLPPRQTERRHLISIADLTRDDIERLLATARNFENAVDREVKKPRPCAAAQSSTSSTSRRRARRRASSSPPSGCRPT